MGKTSAARLVRDRSHEYGFSGSDPTPFVRKDGTTFPGGEFVELRSGEDLLGQRPVDRRRGLCERPPCPGDDSGVERVTVVYYLVEAEEPPQGAPRREVGCDRA